MRAVLVFGLQKGVNDPPPLAIPPPRAIFPMMMFPAPPSDPIRAMANKDEDTPGAPGVGVATRTRAKPKRSEEHTSELQSLMRISYAVFCLKKKKIKNNTQDTVETNHTRTKSPLDYENT